MVSLEEAALGDLPPSLKAHGLAAAEIARSVLRPKASTVDVDAVWPAHSIEALGRSGLLGLHVPKSLGGLGEGLHALAVITEELATGCSSSAICYGMHCVATKVLAAKPTPYHCEQYLRPIAEGRHLSSLALSEPGTGSHFYIPQTTFAAHDEDFHLTGTKSFVTSGGHADSYVISAVAHGAENDPGTFSCFVVGASAVEDGWHSTWNGLGMRGNSSRDLRLDRVRIPADDLLGRQGDEISYMFDVIAPYFLVAMSGTYLGIARAALQEAVDHLRGRQHAHTGEPLATSPVLGSELATCWVKLTRARQMVHHAARLADAGSPRARDAILGSKLDVAEMVVDVCNSAMTLGGGRAYAENSRLSQLLRDARAAHVMAPTTHMLRLWLGRSTLGLPLF